MRLPRITISRWMIAVAILAILIIALPLPFDSTDQRYDTWCPRPQVEGYVDRVDWPRGRVELTVGSDDGLTLGDEVFVWREADRSAPKGRVRVVELGYDRAVGQLLGTRNGLSTSIRRGDRVSPHAR
ncbi:hypothetical protein P12x_005558 [Tundrisphaera lichenicola]|uniref:hypothetical protein n=1 Tax=Tundrisphaera lichenicola TaxID=2029860 RepID=UPI003EBF94A8